MERKRKVKRNDECSSSDTIRKKKHDSVGRIRDYPAKGDQGKLKYHSGITRKSSSSQSVLTRQCMDERRK